MQSNVQSNVSDYMTLLYMLKMPFNSSVANLIFASRELFFLKIILKNLLSVLCVTVKFKQSLKKAIFSSYKVLPFPIFFTIPQFSVIQVCARYFFLFFSLFVCLCFTLFNTCASIKQPLSVIMFK